MAMIKMDVRDPLKQISARAWLTGGVIAALLVLAFWVPITWMVDRWTLPDSYYSHGFIVPLVALFFVWRDRRALLALKAEPSYFSLLLLLAALCILLVSGILTVFFTAAFAMIIALAGLCGFLFGLRVLRRLIFPLFLLTFMIPLPLQAIAEISLRMKLLASQLALLLLDLVGILATNDGSTIYMESGAVVTVGNACSGLRSLIALIFLGVIFAAISGFSRPRKILLFLSSFPIAIAANIVRVFVLCLVANQWGSQAIEGLVHDSTGILIYVVALMLLYGASRLLSLGQSAGAAPEPPAETGTLPPSAKPSEESSHA